MKIERGHRNIYRLTLSSYELSALISAARWVSEGGKGKLTVDAEDHLKELLEKYDHSLSRLNDKLPKPNLRFPI